MTATTPLTEDELDRWRQRLPPDAYFTGRRLIAALRASRDEAGRWKLATTLRTEAARGWEQRALAAEAEVERLRGEIVALQAELWDQWESNHAEHCGIDWSHRSPKPEQRCAFPPPAILLG